MAQNYTDGIKIYPCDLPPNTGNTNILRAIYAKMGNSSSGEIIAEKLDTLIGVAGDINNNILINTDAIEENTKAVKDISINIKIDSKDFQDIVKAIDRQTQAIEDVSIDVNVDVDVDVELDPKPINNIVDSINNLNKDVVESIDRNTIAVNSYHYDRPCPPRPCPPPHPHPCPEPKPDCNPYHKNTNYQVEYYTNKGCSECDQNPVIEYKTLTNTYRYCKPWLLTGTYKDLAVYSIEDFYEFYQNYYICYYRSFDEFLTSFYGPEVFYYIDGDRDEENYY